MSRLSLDAATRMAQPVRSGARGLADVAAIGNVAERIGQQRCAARHILLPSLVVDVLIVRR